ncbi:hypothetical protein [Aeromonas caviae]|uniref:hypothetical protein n=1 Tax=Aeromonas caviae TaxID=648 RepID=UPI0038D095A6
MDFNEWANSLYYIASDSIQKCFEGHAEGRWKEDFITAEILKKIKNIPPKSFEFQGGFKNVVWDAFKYNGKLEAASGDIALIIKLEFPGGAFLEGVAYIEAKKIHHSKDLQSCSYKAIKWDRLAEYSSYSHAHYVMLYDIIPDSEPTYLCKSIPTSHLLALNNNKRDIYPYCEYFHQLLGYRLSMGYGLDFDQDKVNEAKGFAESSRHFKFLLTGSIKQSEESNLVPEPVLINQNLYGSFAPPKPKGWNLLPL